MDLVVTIEGNNVEDYIIEYSRTKSLCSGECNAEITMVDTPYTFTTWDEVIVYEEGNKKATLYIEQVDIAEDGTNHIICRDNAKRCTDYFDENINTYDVPTPSNIVINHYLDLAGVSYSYSNVGGAEYIPENSSFGPDNVMSIVTQLLTMNGWFMMFNQNGNAVISRITFNPASPVDNFGETEVLSVLSHKTDENARNRVVVWNAFRNVYTTVQINTDWMSHANDFRTVVVSNSWIRNEYQALSIASKILNTFKDAEHVKTVEIVGAPNIDTADTVRINTSAYRGAGVVTALNVKLSESGYITTLILDEKCPRLVGNYDLIGYVYIGTWGNGVWRKLLESYTWENYSTGITDLNIVDLFVYNGSMVCVTEQGYAYIRDVSESSWRLVNMTGFLGFVDDEETFFAPARVKATACTIDKFTNEIYITFAYMGDYAPLGADPKSWIVKIDLIPNFLDTQFIKTDDTNSYLAYDLDRNTYNNYIAASINGEILANQTKKAKQINFSPNLIDSRYELPSADWYDIPSTDQTEAEYFIAGYQPAYYGSYGTSRPYMEEDYAFYAAYNRLLVIDFTTDPPTEKQHTILFDTSNSGLQGDKVYIYKEWKSNIIHLIVAQPVGDYQHWSITQHKKVTLDSYFGNVLSVQDMGSTVLIDTSYSIETYHSTVTFESALVDDKIYFYSAFYDGSKIKLYVQCYTITTGSLTTWTGAEIDDELDNLDVITLPIERDPRFKLLLINEGYGGTRQLYIPLLYAGTSKSWVGFIKITPVISGTPSTPTFVKSDELLPPVGWAGQGPFWPRWVKYMGSNVADGKLYIAYFMNLHSVAPVEYCSQPFPLPGYYEGDEEDKCQWGVIRLPDNDLVFSSDNNIITEACSGTKIGAHTAEEYSLKDYDFLLGEYGEAMAPFTNTVAGSTYCTFYNHLIDMTQGFYNYIDIIPEVLWKDTYTGISFNYGYVLEQENTNGYFGFIGQYFSDRGLRFYDPVSNTVKINILGGTWAAKYHTTSGSYYIGIADNSIKVSGTQGLVGAKLPRILVEEPIGTYTVIEESTRHKKIELSLDNPLSVYSPPSGYIPGGFIVSSELPYTTLHNISDFSIFYAYLESATDTKIVDIINISGFIINPSGADYLPEGTIFGGRFLLSTSGNEIRMKNAYLFDNNTLVDVFSGSVSHIETTNSVDPPYIFASITIPSGQMFMQRTPSNYMFDSRSIALPSGEITIIRADDIL